MNRWIDPIVDGLPILGEKSWRTRRADLHMEQAEDAKIETKRGLDFFRFISTAISSPEHRAISNGQVLLRGLEINNILSLMMAALLVSPISSTNDAKQGCASLSRNICRISVI